MFFGLDYSDLDKAHRTITRAILRQEELRIRNWMFISEMREIQTEIVRELWRRA